MLCPSGTFKETYGATNCTSCEAAVGKGFTTATAGAVSADDCSDLLPGYALLRQGRVVLDATGWDGSTAGLRTKLCPQVRVRLLSSTTAVSHDLKGATRQAVGTSHRANTRLVRKKDKFPHECVMHLRIANVV
jgi:hypothetical protein